MCIGMYDLCAAAVHLLQVLHLTGAGVVYLGMPTILRFDLDDLNERSYAPCCKSMSLKFATSHASQAHQHVCHQRDAQHADARQAA